MPDALSGKPITVKNGSLTLLGPLDVGVAITPSAEKVDAIRAVTVCNRQTNIYSRLGPAQTVDSNHQPIIRGSFRSSQLFRLHNQIVLLLLLLLLLLGQLRYVTDRCRQTDMVVQALLRLYYLPIISSSFHSSQIFRLHNQIVLLLLLLLLLLGQLRYVTDRCRQTDMVVQAPLRPYDLPIISSSFHSSQIFWLHNQIVLLLGQVHYPDQRFVHLHTSYMHDQPMHIKHSGTDLYYII